MLYYIIYTLLYIILLHVIYIYINSVHRINPNYILLHVHMISYVLSLRSLAVSFLTSPRHIFTIGATRFHSISQDAVVPVISAGHRDTGSVVIHMVMCHKRTLKDYRLSIRSIWYPLFIYIYIGMIWKLWKGLVTVKDPLDIIRSKLKLFWIYSDIVWFYMILWFYVIQCTQLYKS